MFTIFINSLLPRGRIFFRPIESFLRNPFLGQVNSFFSRFDNVFAQDIRENASDFFKKNIYLCPENYAHHGW